MGAIPIQTTAALVPLEMWAQFVPRFSSVVRQLSRVQHAQLGDVPNFLYSPPTGLQHLSWLVQERQPQLAILTSHWVNPHTLQRSCFSKGRVGPIPLEKTCGYHPLEHREIDTKSSEIWSERTIQLPACYLVIFDPRSTLNKTKSDSFQVTQVLEN